MIKLLFEKGGKYIAFIIADRVVDTIIQGIHLPYFPQDLQKVRIQIMMSRNKIPHNMIELYQLPQIDIEEFNNAKTDEEFKEIIIRDAKKQGARLI